MTMFPRPTAPPEVSPLDYELYVFNEWMNDEINNIAKFA